MISAVNSTWLSRPRKEKGCQKSGFGLDFNPFWLHFGTWRHFFRRKEKRCKKWSGFGLDLTTFWLHFGTWKRFFRSRFSMFFLEVPFSLPGRLLAPMVAKRLPRWSQNGAHREPRGTFWGVRKPWYLLHGRHMKGSRGGSGKQFFPDCVSRPSLEGSREAF